MHKRATASPLPRPRAWPPWTALTLAAVVAALSLAGCASPAPAAPGGISKIRHVVIIMQENRSFDSLFGTFPGADGIPARSGQFTVCVPDPRTKGNKFIEDDFLNGARLDPKTDGRPDPRPDVRENAAILGNLASDFDFAQKPRPPVILPSHPGNAR